MATTERDYYELLGVSRTADAEEIKRAFRRLAREVHPDVSNEPDADHRFREIVEAYEVLSNSERRELYDRFGHAGLRSGGFQPTAFDLGNLSDLFSAFFGDDIFGGGGRSGRGRGADIAARVEIDLAEVATGTNREVPFGVAVPCTRCGGNGAEPDTAIRTCPTCGGGGRVRQVSRSVFGEFVRAGTCPTCSGSGQLVEKQCEQCKGAGRVIEERTLEVEIPPGIHDGQRIRLSGEGHSGTPGARAGDAYVEVHVRHDDRFVREGNDIYSTIDLTFTQAALGATVSVPTLEGDAELTFEPGTQPGEVRVLRGRGLPVLQGFGRGNQRVLVGVTVPRQLTEEQRRLLEEFDGLSTEATYETGEGFFGGVRGEDVAADWRDRWKAFHQPVRVGPLWIGPPWHDPPPDATPIVIDPGRAFGTGAHPTTQLCVELMLELEPASLVDFGCGSGVLSIVAAKLGFAPVIALDADENAVAATIANATANGVEVDARQANVLDEEGPAVEVAVANITRTSVEALAPRLRSRSLVTSGYLPTDDAPLPGFRHLRRITRGGWAADQYEAS